MKLKESAVATALVAILGIFSQACLSPARAAASVQTMGNIGDANKASGLISHYTLHAETRVFDAIATAPQGGISENVIRKVTIQTAHDICADRRGAGWTLRLFLPAQSQPVVTCRFH